MTDTASTARRYDPLRAAPAPIWKRVAGAAVLLALAGALYLLAQWRADLKPMMSPDDIHNALIAAHQTPDDHTAEFAAWLATMPTPAAPPTLPSAPAGFRWESTTTWGKGLPSDPENFAISGPWAPERRPCLAAACQYFESDAWRRFVADLPKWKGKRIVPQGAYAMQWRIPNGGIEKHKVTLFAARVAAFCRHLSESGRIVESLDIMESYLALDITPVLMESLPNALPEDIPLVYEFSLQMQEDRFTDAQLIQLIELLADESHVARWYHAALERSEFTLQLAVRSRYSDDGAGSGMLLLTAPPLQEDPRFWVTGTNPWKPPSKYWNLGANLYDSRVQAERRISESIATARPLLRQVGKSVSINLPDTAYTYLWNDRWGDIPHSLVFPYASYAKLIVSLDQYLMHRRVDRAYAAAMLFRHHNNRWPDSIAELRDLLGDDIFENPISDCEFSFDVSEGSFSVTYQTSQGKWDYLNAWTAHFGVLYLATNRGLGRGDSVDPILVPIAPAASTQEAPE